MIQKSYEVTIIVKTVINEIQERMAYLCHPIKYEGILTIYLWNDKKFASMYFKDKEDNPIRHLHVDCSGHTGYGNYINREEIIDTDDKFDEIKNRFVKAMSKINISSVYMYRDKTLYDNLIKLLKEYGKPMTCIWKINR